MGRQLAVDIEQEAFHVQLGEQAAHRPLLDDGAMVDDRQVAAEAFRLFQVMRGQDDGGAGGVDVLQGLPHAAADLDVHAGGGFVQDQQPGPGHHGAGDHQAPLHAAGQRAAHHLRLLPQLGALEFLFRPHQRLGARHPVEAGVVDQDVDRLLEHVEVDFLRHQADQAQGVVAVARQVDAEHLDLAAALVHQRTDDADQGRLAGAVGAEQGEEITGRDLQRHALQGLHAVVVDLAEIGNGERGRVRGNHGLGHVGTLRRRHGRPGGHERLL